MSSIELRPVQEDSIGKYFVCSNGKVYSKLFCNREARNPNPKRERVIIGGQYFVVLKETRRGKERGIENSYCAVDLKGVGTRAVHRLVAAAFCSGQKAGHVVNHINGVKCDNKASNLEWVSGRRNLEHAMEHGLRKSVDYEELKLLIETTDKTQVEIAATARCSVSVVEKFIKSSGLKRPSRYSSGQKMVATRARSAGTKWCKT